VTLTIPPSSLALICFAFAALLLVALHLLPTGADPVRHGVSEYGIGPFASLYRAQAIASGVGAIALADALLGTSVDTGPLICLVLFGAARVLIAGFPTDRDLPMTRTGQIHAVLAAVAFLALAVVAPWLSASPFAAAAWPAARVGVLGLAVVVTATSLGSFAVASLPAAVRAYGLAQRAFYLAGFAWLIAIAMLLPH